MARCTKCNHKWSAKEVFAVGLSKEGKACTNCQEKQYLSSTTQNLMNVGYISLLFIIIFPFIIKLSDKKEGHL